MKILTTIIIIAGIGCFFGGLAVALLVIRFRDTETNEDDDKWFDDEGNEYKA